MKEKLQKALKAAMGDREMILKAAGENEDGIMSAEQTESFTALGEKIDAIKAQLDAVKDHEENVASLEDATPLASIVIPGAIEKPKAIGVTGEPSIDPKGGYQSLGHYAMDLYQYARHQKEGIGEIPEKLKKWMADAKHLHMNAAAPTNPHKETGQDSALMVPTEFRDETFESVRELPNSLVNFIETTETDRNSITMTADETTPWGTAGIQAYWEGELGQKQESRLATEGRSVKLHKLYILTVASDEILEDTAQLNDRLQRKAPLAIDWKLSDVIANGTGVGQALGYLNSGAKVQVTRDTANEVKAEDISAMYARMHDMGFQRAIWLCSRSVFPQLQTMTIANQPVWLPPNGMAGAPNGTLLGRPLLFNQSCPTLGTADDIQFVDLGWYLGVRKAGNAGVKFDTSMHLYFDYDATAFRWVVRFGGANLLESAIAQPNGDPALSNIVTLNA